MPALNIGSTEIPLDEEGYLANFGDWNEEVACALAAREGIQDRCPLTKERMDILKFIRGYYSEFKSFPVVRAVCKNVRQEKECEYEQFIDPLQAWKVAGLPKPTTEVFALIRHS